MTAKQELLQFLSEHGDNPRVLSALLDMAERTAAGESIPTYFAIHQGGSQQPYRPF